MILLLLIVSIQCQPCASPSVVSLSGAPTYTTAYTGVCLSPAQSGDLVTLSSSTTPPMVQASAQDLSNQDTFTITLWYKSNTRLAGGQEMALFRVSADITDVTYQNSDGVRLGLQNIYTSRYFTGDTNLAQSIIVRYGKSGTTTQTQSTSFISQDLHWCFAVAGLSYSKGKVFYYAWQPYNPSVMANSQPITETVNFNTVLPANAILQLMYWGLTYQTFCGQINNILIYPGYAELDYLHNWLQLAQISSNSITPTMQYKLEDGVISGQYINDNKQGAKGVLGATSAVEASDAVWGSGYLQFSTGQQATLPSPIYGGSNLVYGVSFWFKLSGGITLTADGDLTDLTKQICVIKKYYLGSSEVFGVLFEVATGTTFQTDIKINGQIFKPSGITHSTGVWHFHTIVLQYPGNVLELRYIMYDVALEGSVFKAHQATSLTNAYQESATDKLVLGSTLNGYTGNMQLSNVNFFNTYTLYVDEISADTIYLKCLQSLPNPPGGTNCQQSLNSLTSQYCLQCQLSQYQDDGNCRTSCVQGPNALNNGAISPYKICQMCDYRCSSCKITAGNPCLTCQANYYMTTVAVTTPVAYAACTSCDTSANCGKRGPNNQVGSNTLLSTCNATPNTLCTLCGNGLIDTVPSTEACDDGNFVSGDGCTNCTIDAGYKCPTPGSACVLACGDGVLDSGETCDTGASVGTGGCSSTCLVVTLYYCVANATPPPASICQLLCGNSIRDPGEQCDDGNAVSNDGCTNCIVDVGFICAGLTPDVCTSLCGNYVIDTGEQCDLGPQKANSGCTTCVIDQGWACPTQLACYKVCGNGVLDAGEQCDDGNTISSDGCTTCIIDTDYVCSGGSATTISVCRQVPSICGDGIRKSTESCDDGNVIDGDGCSHLCKVEIGYTCYGGSVSSKDTCYAICGDGKRVTTEDCDDGNTFSGDGCSSLCNIEPMYVCSGGSLTSKDTCKNTCANGVRDSGEQCDDGNNTNGDGCSSTCQIEQGYGCITQTGSHDTCFLCSSNCATCLAINTCSNCYSGFLALGNLCMPGCPVGYYANNYQCAQCPVNCASCNSSGCLICLPSSYLQAGTCYQDCPKGYYNQINDLTGNICVGCTSPCTQCDSIGTCYSCAQTYYLYNGACSLCDMGAECLQCDTKRGQCQLCIAGYYTTGSKCTLIPEKCGDGLLYPTETCDDGNLSDGDGCNHLCQLELNWKCIFYQAQGPSVCFKKQSANVTLYTNEIHYNRIYLQFSRPMLTFNLSNINVSIPILDNGTFVASDPVNSEGILITHDISHAFVPYTYLITRIQNQTLQFEFTYHKTAQNCSVLITFLKPEEIIDIYGYTIETQTRRLLSTAKTYNATLPYYIFYDSTSELIYKIAAWAIFIFGLLALASAILYEYLIGEGRNRKVLEFLQIIATFQFINLRLGLNLELTLNYLYYFNINWMFNVFNFIEYTSPEFTNRFTYYGYSNIFLYSGGGRFITTSIIVLFFLGINELLYRVFRFQTLEYYTEQIHKYFLFNGFIVLIEVFYMDLIISIFIQLNNPDFSNWFPILSFVIAILFLIGILALYGVVYYKVLKDKKAARVRTIFDICGELFDGLLFTNEQTKMFALVPYMQKTLIAIILTSTNSYAAQIIVIFIAKLIFYGLSAEVLPIYYIELFTREVAYDATMAIIALVFFAFMDDGSASSQKETSGYAIMALILVTCLIQMLWVRYAYQIIDRMSPPEIEEKVEIKEEEPVDKHQLHILQQAQEMEILQNEFFS